MLCLLLSRTNSLHPIHRLNLTAKNTVCRMTSFGIFLLFLQVVISGWIFFAAAQISPRFGRCIDNEREALLKFRESLIDHSGRLSSWDGENCCNWTGVSCSNKTGNVVKLDLKSQSFFCDLVNLSDPTYYYMKCLLGKLSPSLINLTHLEYLDLSNNNFEGNAIPSFISSLKNLRFLDLSSASFSGPVPPHLGNLSNLIHLDLTTFSYQSDLWVSDIFWLSNLNSLEYLGLGGVNLSEVSSNWLNEVNKLPSLLELHLPDSKLQDFPQSLPTVNITSLKVLNLYSNFFNSPLPRWVFNISSLERIQLDGCNLTGKIPEVSPGSLCNLRTIDLSSNDLAGEIKEFVDSISACQNNSLEKIHFSFNKFVGNLPDTLGSLSHLTSLSLDQNTFSGTIPRSIGNLSSLFVLDMSFNTMSGAIPEPIGQLNQLDSLRLYGNSWEGTITEAHLQNLTYLYEFFLSSASQSLILNMRPDWIPPFNVSSIVIDDCKVGPRFPSWLKTQNRISQLSLSNAALSGSIPDWFSMLSTNLWWLDLSDNMLEGKLPTSIWVSNIGAWIDLGFNRFEGPLPLWSNVTHLSLRSNLLSGPIPSDIGEIMPRLDSLDLSKNTLNGSIPQSINKLHDLSFLDLSSNYLSGNIPSDFQGLQRLIVLDLSKNNLSGDIPSSICLSSLWWLKLSSNNLTGKLSPTLENCTGIFSVDLGYNRLTGTLSEWIGDTVLPFSYIGLRANMLHGRIPEQLCHFPNLHVLDLANNNLSGSIPKCLGNKLVWKSLHENFLLPPDSDTTHIEFSQRAELVVKGRRNEYTKTFYLVNSLDLSDNNLSGEIPEELTSLSALGTLNLSWNQLSGKIPESIGGMRWLESLDLSFNHLSGHIPSSMVSLTSLSYLNLSYNNLSGLIPTANQFHTFKDTSFVGNSELCGPPLLTKCFATNETGTTGPDEVGSKDDDTVWLYACVVFGFVFGFWVVCGTLVINKSCRIAYFRFVDQMIERFSLVVSLFAIRLQRKLSRERGITG